MLLSHSDELLEKSESWQSFCRYFFSLNGLFILFFIFFTTIHVWWTPWCRPCCRQLAVPFSWESWKSWVCLNCQFLQYLLSLPFVNTMWPWSKPFHDWKNAGTYINMSVYYTYISCIGNFLLEAISLKFLT